MKPKNGNFFIFKNTTREQLFYVNTRLTKKNTNLISKMYVKIDNYKKNVYF